MHPRGQGSRRLRRLVHMASALVSEHLSKAPVSDIGSVFGRLVLRNAIEEVLGPSDFERFALQAVGGTRIGSMALAEQLAAEAGVPLGAVRLLAQGWNIRAVCGVASICDALLRRFVVGLMKRDFRSEKAPAGSLEVLESITGSVTDLKRKQRMAARAAITAALAEGRKILRTWADPLGRQVCWLRKHDDLWLREQLPFQSELKPSLDAAKKARFRAEVLAFKQTKAEADDPSLASKSAQQRLLSRRRAHQAAALHHKADISDVTRSGAAGVSSHAAGQDDPPTGRRR